MCKVVQNVARALRNYFNGLRSRIGKIDFWGGMSPRYRPDACLPAAQRVLKEAAGNETKKEARLSTTELD
jgi:hypothetical protein